MSFYDQKLTIPNIKTFIYVGKNLTSGKSGAGKDSWYFQDPKSYLEHGSFLQLPKKIKREIFIADADILLHMYDIQGLIKTLKKVQEGVLDKIGI
jgi:hypothetical protein